MALPFGQERDWSPPDQTLRPTLPKQRVPGDPPREGQIFHRVTSAVLGPQAAHGLVSNPKGRRERDSNPRYTLGVYTLSRRAPSTTRRGHDSYDNNTETVSLRHVA
jgi:hypothetical protein